MLKDETILVDVEFAQSNEGFDKSFKILAYWDEIRTQHHAQREFLDPLEIGSELLPHVVIIDVLDGGEDFEWRLFGGAHVQEYGVSLKGMRMSTLKRQNPDVRQVEQAFQFAVRNQSPTFYSLKYINNNNCPRAARGVLLPLFDAANAEVTHLVGCSQWVDVLPPEP